MTKVDIKIPKRRESSIEKEFNRKFKEEFPQYKQVKMNIQGRRGWPDRMILGPNQYVVFIEFKRDDSSELSMSQTDMFKWLHGACFSAIVCVSAEEALNYLRKS